MYKLSVEEYNKKSEYFLSDGYCRCCIGEVLIIKPDEFNFENLKDVETYFMEQLALLKEIKDKYNVN